MVKYFIYKSVQQPIVQNARFLDVQTKSVFVNFEDDGIMLFNTYKSAQTKQIFQIYFYLNNYFTPSLFQNSFLTFKFLDQIQFFIQNFQFIDKNFFGHSIYQQ
ncbi:hypothetical protein ABPG72_001175 [Tetrahymena utriculariae]